MTSRPPPRNDGARGILWTVSPYLLPEKVVRTFRDGYNNSHALTTQPVPSIGDLPCAPNLAFRELRARRELLLRSGKTAGQGKEPLEPLRMAGYARPDADD